MRVFMTVKGAADNLQLQLNSDLISVLCHNVILCISLPGKVYGMAGDTDTQS